MHTPCVYTHVHPLTCMGCVWHVYRCVLNAVYAAAEEHVDPACLYGCAPPPLPEPSSLSPCWHRCRYDAIINRMPAQRTREVLEAAKRAGGGGGGGRPTTAATAAADGNRSGGGDGGSGGGSGVGCPTIDYPVLEGPMEYLMGGGDFWDFGASDEVAADLGRRPWGSKRLLSNLKAWMTTISNALLPPSPALSRLLPPSPSPSLAGRSCARSSASSPRPRLPLDDLLMTP